MRARVELKRDTPSKGFTDGWVRRVITFVLREEKAGGFQVGVYLTGDRRIKALNKKFLSHDYATDVISFGAGSRAFAGEKRDHLGDIVISVDMAHRCAKRLGIRFKEELTRYLVHGTLHLLGYEDERPTRAARMEQRQEAILKKIMSGK